MPEDTRVFTEETKHFSAASDEAADRWTRVDFCGDEFEINLNVDGGAVLRWMEHGNRIEAIPKLLKTFIPDAKDYKRLLDVGADWSVYEELVTWLAEKLGDSGN